MRNKLAELPGALAKDGPNLESCLPNSWWSSSWSGSKTCHVKSWGLHLVVQHIVIWKVWQGPPFLKIDVRAPFMSFVLAIARERIKGQGGGLVLQQLEGFASNVLSEGCPEESPKQTLTDVSGGRVFAKLDDAKARAEAWMQ